ncbi:MAG: HD domain-containing protein [Eubacterium sp.]|nr:HD domain-containing protein [Eubacterium sp.]
MTTDQKKVIRGVIGEYLDSPYVRRMKNYIQHGNVTTYRHSVNVVKMAYLLNEKFHLNADLEVLLTAALLHDFYLYDWHDRPTGDLHGYRHPARAVKNAVRIFGVNDRVQAAIRTHMWPLTFFSIPKSKEAYILCYADKLTSMAETLWMRG